MRHNMNLPEKGFRQIPLGANWGGCHTHHPKSWGKHVAQAYITADGFLAPYAVPRGARPLLFSLSGHLTHYNLLCLGRPTHCNLFSLGSRPFYLQGTPFTVTSPLRGLPPPVILSSQATHPRETCILKPSSHTYHRPLTPLPLHVSAHMPSRAPAFPSPLSLRPWRPLSCPWLNP